MNKFGVCNYDFNAYKPKIENLEIYNSYEEAFNKYMQRITKDEHYPYYWDKTTWIVYMEDNKIVQFEQLSLTAKCKYIKINERS